MGFPVTTPFSIRLGVLGAGTMGSGISLSALMADIPVLLFDIDANKLTAAYSYIETHLKRKQKEQNLTRLVLTENLNDFASCNLIIEASPENIDIKTNLFSQLDPVCPPPAILATNTSTLSITAIAARTRYPERVIGMHFFNPAPVMPLVEIIQGAQTEPKVLRTAVNVVQKMGKTPVTAKDRPGFIVNRVARPFYGESLRIVGEGAADPLQIDWILQLGGGFRMGPFQLMDLIGIDINYTAMLSMYEQTWGEPRYKPHWLQSRMIALNTLGRKSGRGFYNYNQTENPTALPELPRRGGNHSHVLLGFGAWELSLVNYLTEAGYSVETKPEDNSRVFVALLSASKTESLRNFVTHWDRILPTDIPLIVQACDITVSEIATWMENPERLVGFDSLFLAQGPIVTLVANPVTTDSIRLTTNRFMESLGNYPVWVADTPGLVLPRVISMIVNEAFFTIQDGVTDPATLDLAMQLGANYPHGPLEWAKKIGYSQILGVLDHLYAEFHEERYRAAPLLRRQMRESLILDNNKDGGKNGK